MCAAYELLLSLKTRPWGRSVYSVYVLEIYLIGRLVQDVPGNVFVFAEMTN